MPDNNTANVAPPQMAASQFQLDDAELKLPGSIWKRFLRFNQVIDTRFEDLSAKTWAKTTYRDFSAGLIVALTAIPMAMGFAIAMGLRPEQGIVAGALACIVGRTWGGSKYQVYGPTAAFIPVIAGLMFKYGHHSSGGNFAQGHGLLVLCSLLAGLTLLAMGLLGLGKYVKWVPNSIVVGFTVGIAGVIGLSNIGEVLGLQHAIRGEFLEKVRLISTHIGEFNGYSFLLAMLTFFMTRRLLKISIFIPAPLLALVLCTFLSETIFINKGIADIGEKYGSIPSNFFIFTPPALPPMTPQLGIDIFYFVLAIVFVSSVESLLCSSMADRLAGNKKTPFNPEKELWGQGLVQIIVPLINGFPCTGALARTATSIKAGAVTPLAGYFKGILKISLAVFLAPWLQMVPMACIGGILLWVATNMVKPAEVKEVWQSGRFHAFLLVYTASMVIITDFLTGVLSAIIIYTLGKQVLERKRLVAPSVCTEKGLEEQVLMHKLRMGGTSGSGQVIEQRVTEVGVMPKFTSDFRLQSTSLGRLSRAPKSKNSRILVPLGGEQQAAMLIEWLSANFEPSMREVILLHVLEPRWWNDTPYSAVRALRMLQADKELLREMEFILRACAAELQGRFPAVRVSWQVRAGRLSGDEIAAVAKQTNSDCILVFTRLSKPFRLIGGSYLIREIVNSADAAVQVFQAVKQQENNLHLEIRCLSGQA